MAILFKIFKTIFFVAVILALGQIKVGNKRVAEHLTFKISTAWKNGPEPWLRKSAAGIESETLRKWLPMLGTETSPPTHRRATRPRPIVDDMDERDRARLQSLLERAVK